jgi:hypothetical protein
MTELPDDILREILSYRSLPSFRRTSSTLDRIERDLLQERADNITRKGIDTILMDVDYDSVRFIIRNMNLFTLTGNNMRDLHLYTGAKGWIDEAKILVSLGHIVYCNNMGYAAAAFGRLSILLLLSGSMNSSSIGYPIWLYGAAAGDYIDIYEWVETKIKNTYQLYNPSLVLLISARNNSIDVFTHLIDTYPWSDKLTRLERILDDVAVTKEILSYIMSKFKKMTPHMLNPIAIRIVDTMTLSVYTESKHALFNPIGSGINGAEILDTIYLHDNDYKRKIDPIPALHYLISLDVDPYLILDIMDEPNHIPDPDITALVDYYVGEYDYE